MDGMEDWALSGPSSAAFQSMIQLSASVIPHVILRFLDCHCDLHLYIMFHPFSITCLDQKVSKWIDLIIFSWFSHAKTSLEMCLLLSSWSSLLFFPGLILGSSWRSKDWTFGSCWAYTWWLGVPTNAAGFSKTATLPPPSRWIGSTWRSSRCSAFSSWPFMWTSASRGDFFFAARKFRGQISRESEVCFWFVYWLVFKKFSRNPINRGFAGLVCSANDQRTPADWVWLHKRIVDPNLSGVSLTFLQNCFVPIYPTYIPSVEEIRRYLHICGALKRLFACVHDFAGEARLFGSQRSGEGGTAYHHLATRWLASCSLLAVDELRHGRLGQPWSRGTAGTVVRTADMLRRNEGFVIWFWDTFYGFLWEKRCLLALHFWV